jgi:phosphorylase kinase alpha/beta subunit
MLAIHNEQLLDLLRHRYTPQDVTAITDFLRAKGTFEFPVLPSGLFPAAVVGEANAYTGYANVWVRDNVHLAFAHHVIGETAVAVRTMKALLTHFRNQAPKFRAILDNPHLAHDPNNRPHIRFDGQTMRDNEQGWAHAQNDALGYFLWFYCKLASAKLIDPSPADLEVLALFPLFAEKVAYWQDEDSGHWEEGRKVSASSIGAKVAGLRELRAMERAWGVEGLPGPGGKAVPAELVDRLIEEGEAALSAILPAECVQADPAKRRRYDGALLFLVYPLDVVRGDMADQILRDVTGPLQGEWGIRRYPGDSYWCGDYKRLTSPETRSADFSDTLAGRDAMLRPGQEAQWCIFDPIVSAVFGRRYRAGGDEADLDRQTHYLNRSLGQVTGPGPFGAFRCPESYYFENGVWQANDVTPLLWTQANLLVALKAMEQSLAAQG